MNQNDLLFRLVSGTIYLVNRINSKRLGEYKYLDKTRVNAVALDGTKRAFEDSTEAQRWLVDVAMGRHL